MIYPIIREDKESKLLIEYIPEPEYNPVGHEYGSPILNNGYNVYEHVEYNPPALPTHNYEQLKLKPIKELHALSKQKFEPGYIFRYFILNNTTYIDVRVISNVNGELELYCMGYKEVNGEPHQFYREKVVMGITYYDKYIESVLARFALKAMQL